MNHPRSRRAFTLVEVLFVVLIVMVLVGLLLSAIGAIRNSARRAQCEKNLAEVGRAMQMFVAQYNGLTPGTIPDGTGMTPPNYDPTGGRWVDLAGNIDKLAMQGWDGYMGFKLEKFSDEIRRMWQCTETVTPYVGNVQVLGRQVQYPGYRNFDRAYLKLSDISVKQIGNAGKVIVAYDPGALLAGENGLIPTITPDVTDWDDGGGAGLTTTAWGYFWYNGASGTLKGPHQGIHNVLRADFSVGVLREPSDPLNPALAESAISIDPNDPAQQMREFTRFPILRY